MRRALRILSLVTIVLSLFYQTVLAQTVATLLYDANLRAGPGTTYPIVGSANAGQSVTIVAANDEKDWLQLDNGAWVASFLVQPQTAITATLPLEPPMPTGVTLLPVANSNANLRTGPDTNFPVLGGAQVGQALDIVAQNETGDWYKLSSGAWIAAFLVDNKPASLAVDAPSALAEQSTTGSPPTPTPLPPAPAAPTPNPLSGQRYGAICRDGTQSGATGRGACSHHGGVAQWLVYP